MQYLSVPDFEKWQHYKDRTPPWIKLHRDILRDYDFNLLPDQSKAHLMLIWLLASQLDNHIPNDPAYVQRMIGSTVKPDIKLLIQRGFLNPVADCERYASKSIATCTTLSNMRETETETETERDLGRASQSEPPTPPPSKGKSGRGTRLDAEWDLPAAWGQWAMEQGMTRDAVIRECDKFKDYWISKSGANATKADWQATWRNWIRKHLEEYAK
ncbi:MAG: hypothetical protein K8U57_37135 [Planctomycetes bacterium]|nr:hypothetical protein [Planctomycetota bacterium]